MRASRRETALAWSAQRLYRPYLRAAVIVALTLGFSTGAGALLLPAVPRTWRMSRSSAGPVPVQAATDMNHGPYC